MPSMLKRRGRLVVAAASDIFFRYTTELGSTVSVSKSLLDERAMKIMFARDAEGCVTKWSETCCRRRSLLLGENEKDQRSNAIRPNETARKRSAY